MFQSKYFTMEQLAEAVPCQRPEFWQRIVGRIAPDAECYPVQYFCELPDSELIRCRVILNFEGYAVLIDITKEMFERLDLVPKQGTGIESSRTNLVYLMSLEDKRGGL